jgi:hypothetical protein
MVSGIDKALKISCAFYLVRLIKASELEDQLMEIVNEFNGIFDG